MNLCGMLLVRPGVVLSNRLINHERIHTAQMREMLFIPFYLWYVGEWAFRVIARKGSPYYHLTMEREAYDNQDNPHYLQQRQHFAWIKYLKNNKHGKS